MNVHHASVFSHQRYRDEVKSLVAEVDQGNYEPLRERTCQAIRRMRQEWPLEHVGETEYKNGAERPVLKQLSPLFYHRGGSLPSESELRRQCIPASRDLGFWFLVVLSEHLVRCRSPLGNWSVLSAALSILGWEQREYELLFCGMPTHLLLKPDIVEETVWPLTDLSPYWLWLHPGRAKAGWLRASDVAALYEHLRRMEPEIREFDVRRFPAICIDNPVVVADFERYLDAGYEDTIGMLSASMEQNRDLFMSITM